MSYIENFVVYGVRCSHRDCDMEIRPDGDQPQDRRELDALANNAGWSKYIGRSVRFYCPLHGPAEKTLARGRLRKQFGNSRH